MGCNEASTFQHSMLDVTIETPAQIWLEVNEASTFQHSMLDITTETPAQIWLEGQHVHTYNMQQINLTYTSMLHENNVNEGPDKQGHRELTGRSISSPIACSMTSTACSMSETEA